jgi:hypothetical protein
MRETVTSPVWLARKSRPRMLHPVHHVLRRGGELVTGIVLAGHVVLAQPGTLRPPSRPGTPRPGAGTFPP